MAFAPILRQITMRIGETHLREILWGASIAFVFKVLGTAAAFAFSLLLTRSLGAGQAGLYFLAIALAEILTRASRMGLDQGAVALVGKHAAREEWDPVQAVFRKGTFIIIVAALLLTGLSYFLAPAVASSYFHENGLADVLRIICLSTLPVALFNFFGEFLKGLRQLHKSQFITTSCHPLLLLLGFIALSGARDILHVAWAYWLAATATALIGYALWRQTTPHLRQRTGDIPTQTLLATAMPLFWANMLLLVSSKMGTFALGYFATAADVAVLNVASRISQLPLFVLFAVNAIVAPKIAALWGQNDLPGLRRVIRNATLLPIVAASPLILAMQCFPGAIMGLFGPEFASHGAVLVVLVIGQCYNIATGPVYLLLAMTGRQRFLRNILCVTTPVHMLMQFVLADRFGTMGAAWATAADTILINSAALYIANNELKLFRSPARSNPLS